MNYRKILHLIGLILSALPAALLLPILTALIYGESVRPFLYTALTALIPGVLLTVLTGKNEKLYAKEGFFIVGAGWLVLSLFSALPYLLSGVVDSYIDAFFEAVSGLTTTGSTLFDDVETLPRSLLLWRSFTQWIGGMGVLVFLLAVLPMSNDSSMHMMRAEMPGPTVDKLVPRMRDTAAWMYGIYTAFTLVGAILYIVGGMPAFEAINHALTLASTGGFSVVNGGLAAYDSVFIRVVTLVMMLLCGINFNVFFLMLTKRFAPVFKNEELWYFVGVFLLATTAISLNTYNESLTAGQTILDAAIQSAAVMTTTGFFTVDYTLWPTFSQCLLCLLMLVGGCAGSTAGGIKISRIMIVVKRLWSAMKQQLHPRTVHPVTMNGRRVEDVAVTTATIFLVAHMCIFAVSFLLLSLCGFSLETTATAVVASIGNIGPGFGDIGPTATFAMFPAAAKLLLCVVMMFGRLEIFPLLLFLVPDMYRKQ